MSLIVETSRPKLMIVPEVISVEDSEMNENAAAINGDDSEKPHVAVLNQSDPLVDGIPSPPAKEEQEDVKAQMDEIVLDHSETKPVDDVEMVELTDKPAVEEVKPVMSAEEVDAEVKRIQINLIKEEMKLSLMKRMFQLQNQLPKQEKREDQVVGTERRGQPTKTIPTVAVVHQNGLKNARGYPEMGLLGKGGEKRDPKTLLKAGALLRPASGLQSTELSKSLAQKSQGMAKYQNMNNSSQSYGQNIAGSQSRNVPASPSGAPKAQQHPVEALEQQLSSEKVLLRRQMEKSILQIVPPRPPLPDVNFIPSTVCPDFIALLGMELAANYAINSKNLIDVAPYVAPATCAKCGEDVCPFWKTDRDTGVVVCEPCFLTSRSNSNRMTHIENLKKAFAEVLEKERDLERQHSAALEKARSAPGSGRYSSSKMLSPAYSNNASVRSQVAAVVNNHNSSSGLHHNSSRAPIIKSHVNNHQNSAHSGSMRPNLPPAPSIRSSSNKPPINSPFAPMSAPLPFAPSSIGSRHQNFGSSPLHSGRQSADVQRQYLLDMISRGPKQQGNGPWRKTSS